MMYLYTIAGVRILCSIPFELHITQESADFLQPLSEAEGNSILMDNYYDFYMILEGKDEIIDGSERGTWQNDFCFVSDPTCRFMYRRLGPGKEPFLCVERHSCEKKIIRAYYRKGEEQEVSWSRSLLNLLNLESILLDSNGLLLHSSYISYNDFGILFSAPSGTGKSTQAELWNTYRGAEIMNGDRAALKLEHEIWKAYGLPFAGSSGIYRNESSPVQAIVILKQYPENRIRRLSPREAFMKLYPEFMIHRFDQDFVTKTTDLISQLLCTIPVYLLECTPDERAVEILEKELYNKQLDDSK
ncbi:MAG: hypothetical protein Q4B85_08495 [Lachnospiraceae bacterium]|nr:hypothetical protein [Lachnospiraceae bacterium]